MSIVAQEIKNNFYYQPTWIIHDIKTFQWLRWNQSEIFEKEKLGGGNILSLLGLFPVLNYFSKVYKILQSGKLPTRDINADKKLFFTEEQAFKRLFKDYPQELIQPKQDDVSLTKVWKIFRNTLTHTAQLPVGNQALVLVHDAKNIPEDLLKKYIDRSKDKSFTLVSEHGFICFVDKFISDVEAIRDWIIEDMDSRFKPENLEIANNWIKSDHTN